MTHHLFSAISAMCAAHMYPAASHEKKNKAPHREGENLKEHGLVVSAVNVAQFCKDFEKIDANRDGLITKDEYVNFRIREFTAVH